MCLEALWLVKNDGVSFDLTRDAFAMRTCTLNAYPYLDAHFYLTLRCYIYWQYMPTSMESSSLTALEMPIA